MSKPSPVITLLDLVWENANSATSHSWERLNHGMWTALAVAIESGFEFAEGDIKYILSNYRSGYWIGASDERIYSLAILYGNMSAVKSYEVAKDRKPFIADDVKPGPGGLSTRKRERLAVNFEFTYGDLRPTVTSFNDDEGYLTACTYNPSKSGYGNGKIKKRLKLTPDDIKADRAERKAALKNTTK